MSSLFAKKPLSLLLEEMAGENRLRRVLGPVQLTSLGVGAIIGAGIFVATGSAAHNVAGPSLMLSYVVAGVTCIFAALCYAEFASMVPGGRLGVHLRVRDARRAVRVDHRLGSRPRVRGRRGDGRQRLVGIFSERAGEVRRRTCRPRSPDRRSSTTRRRAAFVHTAGVVEPAGDRHRGDRDDRAREGHPGKRELQRRDGRS